MPVVEVSCPGCGAKLKAPDSMAGKKAKCKKCGKGFRIPGPAGNSVGGPQATASPLPDDEDTEVMMAEAVDGVEAAPPIPPAPPAKSVSSLPSADPFDFGKPAAAAPAKPAFGSAKAATPAPPVAKPQAAPQAAKPKPAQQPLSLDDDDFQPIEPPAPPAAKAKPTPTPTPAPIPTPLPEPEPLPAEENPSADDPFAFSADPGEGPKPAKSKRRDEEAEKPAKSKPREEEKPAKSKRRDEDEAPKKSRKKDEEDEPPAKAKKGKPAPSEDEPYNPFANYDPGPAEEPAPDEKPTKSKRRDEEGDGKGRKKGKGDEDDSEEPAKPRYRRPEEQGGTGKVIIITAAIGVLALALAVVAGVVYVKNARKVKEQEEQAKKDEKKEEAPANPYVPAAPAPEPPAPAPKVEPKPTDKNPEPKPKDKEPEPKAKNPEPKPKDPEPAPALTRPPLPLPKLRAFTVGALPEKPEAADRPRAGAVLEVSADSVKRVFPPLDPKSADTHVLIQTNAGFNGKGEKLALDSYGPAGNRVAAARIEYDGDGSPVPIADLHASPAGVHFLAATGGKLHVWSVLDKQKKAEGVDPYATKPDHAKAGLAAAFFSAANPNQVVTVSTAGAVLLFDWSANKVLSEFIPPDGAPGRVALGLSVAKADGNGSVAVAVAGVLYQLKAVPGLEVMRKYDLGGDVGRSLGLAVSGTPGRLLYAFETAPDKARKKEKEKAVMLLPLGDTAKHVLFPLPASVGEPKGALWAGGVAGGVATDKGVLWFDDDEGKTVPTVFTQPPTAGQYYGDERYFWYVVAHPKEAGKSVLVALSAPFNDFSEFLKNFPANQPLRTVKIDGNGLSK